MGKIPLVREGRNGNVVPVFKLHRDAVLGAMHVRIVHPQVSIVFTRALHRPLHAIRHQPPRAIRQKQRYVLPNRTLPPCLGLRLPVITN